MAKSAGTKDSILEQAAKFCAYQERCHQEVLEKLGKLGVYGVEADELVARLIELGYLNEERFARAFAGGRFRIKHWGRQRIRRELALRKVSAYCIEMAMEEIPEDQYCEVLERLSETKWNQLTEKNVLIRRNKTATYLIGKGFEPSLVWDKLRHKI